MPIVTNDLHLKRSYIMDDSNSSGGPVTSTDIGTNLFPDVTGSERTQGVTKYRKFFFKNENYGTGGVKQYTLNDAKVYVKQISPAGDAVFLRAGSALDTYNDHVNSAPWRDQGWAGVGILRNAQTIGGVPYVLPNATSMDIDCEAAGVTGNIFFPGTMLLDNGTNQQYLTISSVTWNGSIATINFPTTPLIYQFDRYSHTYVADLEATPGKRTGENTIGVVGATFGGTNNLANKLVLIHSGTGINQIRRVITNNQDQLTLEYAWTVIPYGATFHVLKTMASMCVSLGNIVSGFGNVTYPNGTGFNSTANIITFPVGTIDQTWTIHVNSVNPTFTVTVTGSTLGTLGGGPFPIDGGTPLKPQSPNSSYYFQLNYAGFVDPANWNGKDLTFTTTSSSAGVWAKQVVPQGIDAHLNNSWELGATGDTV